MTRQAVPERTPVAVLGASGLVGQRIIGMLHDHPWLRVAMSASK